MKKPRKLNAKQRQLAADWEKLVKKYEPKKKIMPLKNEIVDPVVRQPFVRKNVNIVSSSEWVTGAVSTKAAQQYTGDKMIGIGTMHKSNAVPIFNDSAAKDISSMRR